MKTQHQCICWVFLFFFIKSFSKDHPKIWSTFISILLNCLFLSPTVFNEKPPLFMDVCKIALFPFFPFSYICRVINRHEKQADASILFPCRFCTFLFFFSTPQTTFFFIEFTTENKKNKAWHKLNFLLPAHRSPPMSHRFLSCVCVANPREQKYIYMYIYIYIYIVIHSYSMYIFLGLQSKMGRKWRRFYKKQSFKKGGGDFSCTQWTFFL